jgi:N-acylneuraminate cytidylyltransferase/CMP-N,N'-diacetyllegionaminic acid synthase
MIDSMRILGLIPARAGTKGLPQKNVMQLGHKPLIAWSIDEALRSKFIDSVVVTTENQNIADIAKYYGAEVPFKRPLSLALDDSPSIDVVLHALEQLESLHRQYDFVVLLEPTSPLREAGDIDLALIELVKSNQTSLVSVCRSEAQHPKFMYTKDQKNHLLPYMGVQPTGIRRQDLDPVFFLDGTIYISKVQELKLQKSFFHEHTIAFEVPKWKSIEVDDQFDFAMVEALAKLKGLI